MDTTTRHLDDLEPDVLKAGWLLDGMRGGWDWEGVGGCGKRRFKGVVIRQDLDIDVPDLKGPGQGVQISLGRRGNQEIVVVDLHAGHATGPLNPKHGRLS